MTLFEGLDLGGGLVSCLMPTQAARWKNGLPLGVQSFLRQSWPRKELVLVTCDPCDEMDAAGFDVNVVPKATLGGLRQDSLELAAGEFVATWDDDDWSHPDRLKLQIGALSAVPHAEACVLLRIAVDDTIRDRAFTSPLHGWEMTMVARRECTPAYNRELQFGEDTDCIGQFRRVILLDRPDLYRLVVHPGCTASNRWAPEWWEMRDRWRGGAP